MSASTPPATTPKAGRSRRMIVLGLGLLAATAGSVWFFAGQPVAQSAKPVAALSDTRPVLVRVVSLQPASQPRVLVGTLRARIEGDLGFRVAGKVASRAVQLGDRVKAGQIIATLDATDFRLQRETSVAELEASLSSEKQAQAELSRILELRRRGWSTEQALDRQKAAVDEAKGRRARAERNLELATNAQSYADLRAETDGIITQLFVEVGQVVAAGQTVIRIARDGDREAQIAVPEHELELARKGAAEVTLWSRPDMVMKAQLREIAPNADAATRTFQARYLVPELPADAPLGMTVTLRLSVGDPTPVARVPLGAILNEGGGTEIFVVEASGELKRRAITVSSFDSREAVVSKGLQNGDRIVIMGVHKLRAGDKVRTLTDARAG
jgi:RND family efflux transporter MFP subunit